jgi:NitT/TauT family transport system substrate-binding protein
LRRGQLRIGHLSTFYHTSFILMGTGWIEAEMNVDVDWELFAAGPEIVQAFADGRVDIGYIGLPPAVIGIDRGIPIKCIAGGHVEGTVLVADKKFKSLEELGSVKAVLQQFGGGTIASPQRGSIHDVIIRHLIREEGLEEAGIAVKNFEWADLIPDALLDGEVQAAVGTPALAVAVFRVCDGKMVIPPSRMWPYNPSYGILASKEMVENTPSLLEDFLRLHEKASNLIREEPEKAARIVSRVVGLVDEDFVLQVYRVSPRYCASLPREYIDSTLAFLPVLKKLGYISRMLREEDIFNLSFIRKIHPQTPHY